MHAKSLLLAVIALIAVSAPLYGETIMVYDNPASPLPGTLRGIQCTFPSGGLETGGPLEFRAYVEGITSVEITLVGLYEWDAIADNVGTDEPISLISPDSVNDGIRSPLGSWTYPGVLDTGIEVSLVDADVDFTFGDALLIFNDALGGAHVEVTFTGGSVTADLPAGPLNDGFAIHVVPEPATVFLALEALFLGVLALWIVRFRKRRALAPCPVVVQKRCHG